MTEIVVNPPGPMPTRPGSLYLTDAPAGLESETEPCENCGLPVVVLSMRGFPNVPERPRLMELAQPGGPAQLSEWVTHTPTRCRTARRETHDD